MKTIKRAVQVLACGLCAVAVAPSAMAEAQRGFYLGISPGKATFDLEKAELDRTTIRAFSSVRLSVRSLSSTIEDTDNAVAFFAGYRFLPYLAVEGSIINLGAAQYNFTGSVTEFILGSPPRPASLTLNVESKGLTIAGIGSLPVGNVVDLHGRLGLLFAQTDISVVAATSPGIGRSSDTLESVSGLFGLGVGFHLGQHWSLSFDWSNYINVGDENDDDDYNTTEGFDISTVSFSAAYRF